MSDGADRSPSRFHREYLVGKLTLTELVFHLIKSDADPEVVKREIPDLKVIRLYESFSGVFREGQWNWP